MKQWFVVHTLPRSEESALKNLQAQGLEAFLPCYQRTRRHARKVDVVLAPLFPRYLFVALDLKVDRWLAVESTRGVAYIIRQIGCPIALPVGIIESLKKQVVGREAVSLSYLGLFKKGSTLEILQGPFAGYKAIYEQMADEERVQLLMNLLGSAAKITVPLKDVALVA